MTTQQRVLVLDGHTNQALAVVRSLGRAGHDVFVASRERRPLAAWSRHCRQSVVAPTSPNGLRRLRQWAGELRVDVVLPMTEQSCVLLNHERREWTSAGIVLGCADDAILERAFDKGASIEWARQAGVACPDTCAPTTIAEAIEAGKRFGWRAVVKPVRSHAWTGDGFQPDLGCAYVSSAEGLERAISSRMQGGPLPLVQRYVDGVGRGVFTVWCHGRPLAWFAHERLRDVQPTGSGSSLRRAAPLETRLRAPAERLLSALGWHGPAMVEFRDDGTTPWLMEVNGRFWNSLQLAIDAGIDFPGIWLDALTGSTSVRAADSYRTDVTLRWLFGDVKRLLYIASGRPKGFVGDYPTLARGLREVLGRQPAGTRLEAWRRDDPWPAVGEWAQGLRDVWRSLMPSPTSHDRARPRLGEGARK